MCKKINFFSHHSLGVWFFQHDLKTLKTLMVKIKSYAVQYLPGILLDLTFKWMLNSCTTHLHIVVHFRFPKVLEGEWRGTEYRIWGAMLSAGATPYHSKVCNRHNSPLFPFDSLPLQATSFVFHALYMEKSYRDHVFECRLVEVGRKLWSLIADGMRDPLRDPPSILRHMAGWICVWMCSWASSAWQRIRGVVHECFQISFHPFLCHCLHTAQFHPCHRAGLRHKRIDIIRPKATSPANHRKYNTDHCRLEKQPQQTVHVYISWTWIVVNVAQ